jgi:hypothetical protein
MGKYPINGGFSIATLDYWAWCPMLRDRPLRLDRARVLVGHGRKTPRECAESSSAESRPRCHFRAITVGYVLGPMICFIIYLYVYHVAYIYR